MFVNALSGLGAFQDSDSGQSLTVSRAIAFSHVTTPFFTAYPWNNTTGFGAKYANPITLPASTAQGVAFSKQGDAIALAHNTSPRISVYPFNPTTGIGVKYANPVTLPTGNAITVDFSNNGNHIAVGHLVTPFVTAYPFNITTGIGVKYSNPVNLPSQNCLSVKFSPTDAHLAVFGAGSTANTGYRSIYAFSSSGFGSRTDQLFGQNNITGCDWHPSGNAIAFSQSVGGVSLLGCPITAGVFGTDYSTPSSSNFVGVGVGFNRTGNICAVAHEGTPFMGAYQFNTSTGFGTKFSNPSTLATGNGRSVAFSHDDKVIALAHFTTPFASAWIWDNTTGFGTKYANPSTLPTGNALGVAFCK